MERRQFIKNSIIGSSMIMTGASVQSFVNESKLWKNGDAIMPVLFIGHGAPLYTLDDNKYSRAWKKIADEMPTPKAIVCISAHWLTKGSFVTAMEKPKTIHDFGRIDDRLFEIDYKAPGNPDLAHEIAKTLTDVAKHKLSNEMIQGFEGSKPRIELNVKENYILGIASDCL